MQVIAAAGRGAHDQAQRLDREGLREGGRSEGQQRGSGDGAAQAAVPWRSDLREAG
jgi:hypothetical protein